MSDENEGINDLTANSSTPPAPAPALPLAAQLVQAIKENVKTASEGGADSAIFGDAVHVLASKIVEERVDLLVKGEGKYTEAKREYEKINKPDVMVYDADGKAVGSGTYSKGQLDKIGAAKKKLDKITKAIDKALNDLDFNDLKNLVSN